MPHFGKLEYFVYSLLAAGGVPLYFANGDYLLFSVLGHPF